MVLSKYLIGIVEEARTLRFERSFMGFEEFIDSLDPKYSMQNPDVPSDWRRRKRLNTAGALNIECD